VTALDTLGRVVVSSLAVGQLGGGDSDGGSARVRELRAACAAALVADAEPTDVVRTLCQALRLAARAHPKGTWMAADSTRPADTVEFVVRTVWQHSDEGLRERLLADVGSASDNLARAMQACALRLAEETFSHGGFFGRGVPCMLR
jgi:hypothetical protein